MCREDVADYWKFETIHNMPAAKKTIKTDKTISKTVKKTVVSELSIPLYNLKGDTIKSLTVAKDLFKSEINKKLIAQYVRVYLANQRGGKASAKTRGQVTGSTRKIYRQKGTGRARHGSIKAPIFVGGGVVGGPNPRDFSLKMSKKQKRVVMLSALSSKFEENAVSGLDATFSKISGKTKEFASFLKSQSVSKKDSVLLILPKMEKNNLVLAVRNIPNIIMSDATSINPYLILKSKKIYIHENAVILMERQFLAKV